jgi:hypothetical protein
MEAEADLVNVAYTTWKTACRLSVDDDIEAELEALAARAGVEKTVDGAAACRNLVTEHLILPYRWSGSHAWGTCK